jgi:hypothetical protein
MIFHLLSGPRNISTALMYSFAQRPDMEVLDEPLYGYYLSRVDIQHPGREEVLKTMETDGEKILKSLIQLNDGPLHVFAKNMAHHYVDLPYKFLLKFSNIFLIRDPREMLLSLLNQIPNPVLRDTGLQRQWELFNFLHESGQEPLVLDAKTLLSEPRLVLMILCNKLGLKFYDQMLCWPKGPKAYDGIWAKYWYTSLHQTSGFIKHIPKEEDIPVRFNSLYQQCVVFYERLFNFSIKI